MNDPYSDPLKKLSLSDPIHLMALGFGSGLSPKAPGTVGTIVAVPIVSLMHIFTIPVYVILTILAAAGGVYICNKASEALGEHDHQAIVWDEFVGFMVACIALPVGLGWLFGAFVLFRLLDIFKPWPISWIDKKVKGGWGIMLDDIVAGLITCAVIQLINFI